jgi:hypothetical protein
MAVKISVLLMHHQNQILCQIYIPEGKRIPVFGPISENKAENGNHLVILERHYKQGRKALGQGLSSSPPKSFQDDNREENQY